MLCSLKTNFCTKWEEEKTSGKITHETALKDEGPNEPTVNVDVEPRRSQRSRILKSFGSDFIA